MSDLQDRLDRLRRAGRLKRPAAPQPPAPAAWAPQQPARPLPERSVSDLLDLPGMELVSEHRSAFLLRTLRFELGHVQGKVPLGALLDLPPNASVIAGRDAVLEDFDFRRAVFIDTETSGLAGGTGTIVFLTGVGRFEDDAYVVRQYFARTPAEEPPYLRRLAADLEQAQGFVSFNGKAFDLPLLSSRFILAGLRPPGLQRPHLDLLHPARRLWRSRLGACNFTHLENRILGHERSGEDVPSWLIPNLWFRYAAGENNVSDMVHVLYHNLEDIVSMAPLAHEICGTFGGLLEPHPQDLLAVAHSHAQQGRLPEAEQAYRRCSEAASDLPQYGAAILGLAAVLKRQEHLREAAFYWETLAQLGLPRQMDGHIELAKYHEWHTGDLVAALRWTVAAQELARTWSPDFQRNLALEELRRRQERLERKLDRREQSHADRR